MSGLLGAGRSPAGLDLFGQPTAGRLAVGSTLAASEGVVVIVAVDGTLAAFRR
jgi:hypothetical protein